MKYCDQTDPRLSPARRTAPWMLAVAMVWLVGMVVMGSQAAAEATTPAVARQDVTEDAFFKVCGDCHDPDRIRETKRTRGGWEDIIYQMIDKGAIGTERDFELVLQYLLSHYGMVNVNQSEAPEIALVAGLTPKEAELVVSFRKEHGNFKSFEALTKVPGLDIEKLEARRPSLLF
jgi:competence protein ComEA